MPLGRNFTALWSANALSNLADGIAFVSMPLLAASMTNDPRLVAGLATLYAVVRLLVALPIGVWVDRLDRRTLIVAANLLRGLGLLALAMTIQFGVSALVVLYAAMAVVGTLESMADSAAVAILPSLVDRERLDAANGRVAAAQLVCDEFVGPPLGGFLFALAAALPVFTMGGLWTVGGFVALALPIRRSLRVSGSAPADRRSVYGEAWDGIAWLAHHRVVGSLAIIGALASIGYMLPFSILVLIAQERLGLNGTGYGLLLSFSALGGLLGSLLAPRLDSVPTGARPVRHRYHHCLSGLRSQDRGRCSGSGHVRCAVLARPDDLDQAVVSVDDVPLRLGDQGGTAAGAIDTVVSRRVFMRPFVDHVGVTSTPTSTVMSSWRRQLEASPVRVQWDPERGMDGAPLAHRSLQVGLSGAAMTSYVTEWIVAIDNITAMLPSILSGARPRPNENVYPLPIDVQLRIGADSPTSPDHL